MSKVWRFLLLTLVLAGTAGFVGAYFGTAPLRQVERIRFPVRVLIDEISKGALDLTPEQLKTLETPRTEYTDRTRSSAVLMTRANAELAVAMTRSQVNQEEVDAALLGVLGATRERQREGILYLLEVRKVLTPEQRAKFDAKVTDALAVPPP